ncbi:hypothetical protein GA0070607_3161 [Micromonospora coriariae]|uniref:Uncharacterized protein n=1 Tax=Micromonospora coriariae TaxID=285665 RepID=A0A1C4W5P7_9ACTN|nr:hypothetical protein GA0070607_3161 [Micromonospora coriariae]
MDPHSAQVGDSSATLPGKPFIDVTDLCQRYAVKPRAVYSWLQRSRPGGIYANRPFPAPAGYHGRQPYWLPRQLPAVDEWRRSMPGRGAGGGRPPRRSEPNG